MTAVSMDPRLRARRVEVLRLRGRRRLRALVAAVALLAAAFAIFGVLRSSMFDVDTIAVDGADRTGAAAVQEQAATLLSQPLLEVEIAPAEAAIRELPWVESVSSAKSVDGTVTFTVVEREAAAIVPGPDGWLVVDLAGRVLERTETVPKELPVVGGAVWNATPGAWLPERALVGVEVASLLPAALAAQVASVDGTDPQGIRLDLFGGPSILLGDADALDDKFLAALTLLDQVDPRCLGRIDVRAPSVPVLTRLPDCS